MTHLPQREETIVLYDGFTSAIAPIRRKPRHLFSPILGYEQEMRGIEALATTLLRRVARENELDL